MAIYMHSDASLVVNSVDLSDHVRSITVNMARDDLDKTVMGASGHGRLPGLRDESFDVTFAGDFASAKVDATLAPLYTNGTSFTVVAKPTSAAVSATNPTYTGTCLLNEFHPIAGDVGALAEVTVTFLVDGVITRATS